MRGSKMAITDAVVLAMELRDECLHDAKMARRTATRHAGIGHADTSAEWNATASRHEARADAITRLLESQPKGETR